MTSVSPAIPETAERGQHDQRLAIGVSLVALLAALGFVFEQFLINQGKWGIRQPADWGHTLVIPIMGVHMAWIHRDKLARVPFRTAWVALIPIALGVGWYMLCWIGPPAIRNHTLQGWGLGLTVLGLVLLFFGFRAMRWLLFPVAYVFMFGIKIGDSAMNAVTYKLQDLAAKGSYYIFQVLQFDVTRKGNTLELWANGVSHDLNIAEACSGMRMLVAFLALGVWMAYTMLDRRWQQVTLVLLAVPVALFVNMLRVVTLGLLSLVNPDFAAGDFHTFVGLVWLVPAFLIYLGLMWVLRRIVVEDDGAAGAKGKAMETSATSQGRMGLTRPPFAFDHRAKYAVIVACITLVASGLAFRSAVGALNIYLTKEAVPLRRALSAIPTQLGDWQKPPGMEDAVFSEAVIEQLGTKEYLSRNYVNRERREMLYLHIAYYTDQIDAVPHVPERCFTAQGRNAEHRAHFPLEIDTQPYTARPLVDQGPANARSGEPYQIVSGIDRITQRKYEVRLPLGDFELRTFLFRDSENSDALIAVGYLFIANGWTTPNATDIRRLAFDQTDEHAYYCKVEFSMPARGDLDMEEFVESVNDLLNPLLPELMRCLPDWADVEQGRYPVMRKELHESDSEEAQ